LTQEDKDDSMRFELIILRNTVMTRINIVEPEQLTKQHLLAEYRELPRVFTHILKAAEKGKTTDDFDIPDKYTIGKGHVTFFYDKADYLYWRFHNIADVLEGTFEVNLNKDLIDKVDNDYGKLPGWAYGEYSPTPEEIYLNMYRLANRHFFKLTNDHNDDIVVAITNNGDK
jgi:deoxyribonuclease (pyrimidine dimer)